MDFLKKNCSKIKCSEEVPENYIKATLNFNPKDIFRAGIEYSRKLFGSDVETKTLGNTVTWSQSNINSKQRKDLLGYISLKFAQNDDIYGLEISVTAVISKNINLSRKNSITCPKVFNYIRSCKLIAAI